MIIIALTLKFHVCHSSALLLLNLPLPVQGDSWRLCTLTDLQTALAYTAGSEVGSGLPSGVCADSVHVSVWEGYRSWVLDPNPHSKIPPGLCDFREILPILCPWKTVATPRIIVGNRQVGTQSQRIADLREVTVRLSFENGLAFSRKRFLGWLASSSPSATSRTRAVRARSFSCLSEVC